MSWAFALCFAGTCCGVSLIPRPRPAFHRFQYATESCMGPGNEASVQSSLADLLHKMVIGNHLYGFLCIILVSCHQTFGSNKDL